MFALKQLSLICAVFGALIAIVSAGSSAKSDDAARSCSEVVQGPASEARASATPETTLRGHQANGDVEEHVSVCHQGQTASAAARAKGGKSSAQVRVSVGNGPGASASSRATSRATSR